MPVFLTSFIILTIWVTYQIRKSNKRSNHSMEDFWERETNAVFARPVDINTVDYLEVPLDLLPFQEEGTEAVLQVQNYIKELSAKHILNLSGLTNTDIKYKYGFKNYEHFARCDQNFTLLVRNLDKWAHLLYEEKLILEAKQILEYAISCKSDVSKTYILLGEIYFHEKSFEKISELMDSARELDTLMKDSILENLQGYLG